MPATQAAPASFYTSHPGAPDEMLANDGTIRPLWRDLARVLTTASAAELATRRAKAEQYMRDSGVFYRQYRSDGSDERPWPLSAVPVLVSEAEWNALTPGLIQRAELMERLMADFYGPNRMVAEGHLPPELVAKNAEWLRPMVGIVPPSGHFLHFLSFEIGRGPDGQWWVLADRTQAPSGAGYAVENRVATSLAFSDLYTSGNVHRLAGFFRDFREALQQQCAVGEEGRAVILTPGPMNETYFEHAYIARYLGLTLVQGEDLTVADGRLHIRTVAGPKPVDVLWRRLDSSYADPVELEPSSRIGTPGMVAALRAGRLSMVNQLGSGVLETRALMAFFPVLCRALLGQNMILPNIATWWLGDEAARNAAFAGGVERVIAPALTTAHPLDPQSNSWLSSSVTGPKLAAKLRDEGAGLVAQEVVSLSTTPSFAGDQLVPRPMTLRVFLARGPQGWQVMPGGFARIGASADPAAIAMQTGGATADVWVMSPHPVPSVTMIQRGTASERRAMHGSLPSRSADNLFWLGRYVERTETMMRLLRALQSRVAEMGKAADPLIRACDPLLRIYGVSPETAIPQGLLDTLSTAIGTAGRVRDRFSPDAWSALADIEKTARRMATRVTPGDDAARALSALLRKLAGISGLVHENMYRALGWRFLSLGRLQERAMGMSAMLAVLADDEWGEIEGALDLALELGDLVLTHRRRFAGATTRGTVIDLLGLDADNPRALRSQIDGLREQITLLPGEEKVGMPAGTVPAGRSPLLRDVMRMQVELATESADELTTDALWALRGRVAELSDLLTEGYFR